MAKVKSIMIQSTMSNVGKSLLAADLCRIFYKDGYKAVPFKSQNTALNSFITEEGLEMGRVQVVQSEAAGIKPSVNMNPILLKPTTDVGFQVIVNGVHHGNMSAREYLTYKKQLVSDALQVYHQLKEEYDIIVTEGAGSPAKISLKSEDIVNMGMAKMADAPVLLAGDTDRGGVFAQLYGTIMLLEQEERECITGSTINKLRGDKIILDSGIRMIEDLRHIPVVGVVSYMQVDVEDEDSLSSRLGVTSGTGFVDIAVIRLPRISNFADFQVLSAVNHVTLRYVSDVRGLGQPDMVILPGTKSTIEDLLWLRQCGLEVTILKLAASGISIMGVRGGYQMLGMSPIDESHVENDPDHEHIRGAELFLVNTIYGEGKTKIRVTGTLSEVSGILSPLSGQNMEGYEIHMGRTEMMSPLDYDGVAKPLAFIMDMHADSKRARINGATYGNVCGTYVHDILDCPSTADRLVQAFLKKKGYNMEPEAPFGYVAYKEEQFQKLSSELRASLDMNSIYKILGLPRK